MTDVDLPDLGDVQREVLQVVWKLDRATADEVRRNLERPLKETTVRTVLRRLEEKGYVTHTVEKRTFVYSAISGRGLVAAKAVRQIVDWFCNGSFEEVLLGLVDAKMVDRNELQRLANKIAKLREGRK